MRALPQTPRGVEVPQEVRLLGALSEAQLLAALRGDVRLTAPPGLQKLLKEKGKGAKEKVQGGQTTRKGRAKG